MTGPFISLLVSLFDVAGLSQPQPWLIGWPDSMPETPAADVVRIKPPFALVKHHSKGPNPPTKLVRPYHYIVAANRPGPSAKVAGQPMEPVYHDAERVTMSGDWLVSQDRMGQYSAFDLSKRHPSLPPDSSLDTVNDYLIWRGCAPVSDADFRTFEQWAEERDRQRTTRSVAVLSTISLGWLAVAGSAFWFRRRSA